MAYKETWPDFSDVLKAYQECRVGKQAGIHQAYLESKLSESLLKITKEIRSRRYKPFKSSVFVVTHPKPREVFAAHFRDRIVHHLIVSKLQPIWEKKFSPMSFACRKGKGTHGALKEFQRQVRKVSGGGNHTVYALQLDIASFFVSINRPILKELFIKSLNPKEETLRWLIEVFMDHDPRKDALIHSPPSLMALIPPSKSWFSKDEQTGLPIGNLTSQFGANVYLNELDHWIQRKLKPQSYLRYMDDLTLLDRDPNKLRKLIDPIDQWLKTHRLQEMNTSKTTLTSMREGIDYLGFRIIQTDCSKNPARLHSTPKTKWSFVKDLKNLSQTGLPPMKQLHPLAPVLSKKKARTRLASVNSRLGLFKHADNYRFKKEALMKLDQAINIHDRVLSQDGETVFKWEKVRIKKDLSSVRLK